MSLPRSWAVASSRELRCSVRAGRPKALQSGDSLEKGDEAAVCSFLCDLQHTEAMFRDLSAVNKYASLMYQWQVTFDTEYDNRKGKERAVNVSGGSFLSFMT